MPDRIDAALERAARYRRSRVPEDWQRKANLTELVSTQRPWQALPLPDGWWDIGQVLDTFSELRPVLPVHWHPETNRVRVGSPPRPEPRPSPPAPDYTDYDFNRSDRSVLGYSSPD